MRSASCSKSPKFKDLVRQNCPPLVFKGALIDWSPGKWTLSHINSLLGDKLMTCKVSSVGSEGCVICIKLLLERFFFNQCLQRLTAGFD